MRSVRLSDVYSLGATLYTLLAGKGPFSGRTAMEALRLLLDFEPEPPCRLNPTVPRDLEAICLKAMNKRPDCPLCFSARDGRGLEAFFGRPPDLWRGCRAWRSAWLAGCGAARSGSPRSSRPSRPLRSSFPSSSSCRRPAAVSALRAGASSVAPSIDRTRRTCGARVELGETRIRDHSENREGRRTLATLYHRLGDLLVNTDRLADAPWAYERAVTLLRQDLRGEAGDVTPQIELAEVLGSLGEACWALGRAHDARAAYREAVIVRQSVVMNHPKVPAYQDDLTRTLNRLNELSNKVRPEPRDGA